MVLITYLLICLAVFMFLHGRSAGQPGFQSINCGGRNMTDNSTGIQWISDNGLVDHGNYTGEIEASLQSMTSAPLRTLRYFPKDPRNSKFCYSLAAVTNGSTYIVRATFLYGNYDGLNRPPSFVLLLNYDVWVRNVTTTTSIEPTVHEIMYISFQDSVSVCLAPHSNDTPFISTLELRPLNSTMYKKTSVGSLGALNMGYGLRLKYRVNYGAATRNEIRYPNDKFDRIWVANTTGPILTTSSKNMNTSYAYDSEKPPPAVMATAITASNHTSLTFEFENFGGVGGFFIALHFAELVPGVNERSFSIEIGGNIIQPSLLLAQYGGFGSSIAVSVNKQTEISSPLNVTLVPSATTVAGPLLNAIELLQWIDEPLSKIWTSDEDLSALQKFQKALNLTGYGDGDPCLPQDYGWTWIVCNDTPPTIKEINLPSFNLSGNIPSSITSLSQLRKIDLSNNNLTGSIPDLNSLVYLQVLDLQNNELTGEVPQSLGLLSELRQLHLDHNNLCGSIPSFVSKNMLNLTYIGNPNLCNGTQCTCPRSSNMNSSKSKKSVYIFIYPCLAALYILLMIVVLLICKQRIQKVKQGSSIISSDSTKEGILGIQNILFITRKFSYTEVIAATNDFTTKIGEGGFGKVFKGFLQSGEVVAVKMLADTSNQGVKEFCTEVAILSRLRHKNLVSLVGYCIETTHMLIYEYISKGNLSDLLYGEDESIDKPINWRTRLKIALDASQGLEYLHMGCDPIIIHRDVKSRNILLNDKMEAKVSDFGFSRLKDGDSAVSHVSTVNVLGTVGYLDPTYNATNQLTDKSDVYSFGVVLFELICGRPPIDAFRSPPYIVDWATPAILQGKIGDIVDPVLMNGYKLESMWKVIDVALGCVDSDRSKRPSMSEVVHVLREAAKIETDNTLRSEDVSSSSSTSEGRGPILRYIEGLRRTLEPR